MKPKVKSGSALSAKALSTNEKEQLPAPDAKPRTTKNAGEPTGAAVYLGVCEGCRGNYKNPNREMDHFCSFFIFASPGENDSSRRGFCLP